MKLRPRIQFWMAMLGALATGLAVGADAPALPPLDLVLARLAEQSEKSAANDEAFKQYYRFTRSKVFEVRNAKGELDKREIKTQANQPTQPAATWSSHHTEPIPPNAAVLVGQSKKPARKADLAVDHDFLRRFQFTLVGRVVINDRPTLMVDLQPATNQPAAHDLKERILAKTAGRIWVDEAEAVLVQADLHLTESVKVVGGLVGMIASCKLSFSRMRTREGFWYTPRLDWELGGREILARRTWAAHEEVSKVQWGQ